MKHNTVMKYSDECAHALHEVLQDRYTLTKAQCAAIMKVFFGTDAHMTVADMQEHLAEKGVTVSDEIVLEALQMLVEFGYAAERAFAGVQEKRYEHVHEHGHHDHFICVKCDRIIEFSDDELEEMQSAIMRRKGLTPLSHKFEVYGICDVCAGTGKGAMTLASSREDAAVTIMRIDGGLQFKKRVSELGFIRQEKVRIIKNAGFGPIIVEVKNARFALGRGEAQHIRVREAV